MASSKDIRAGRAFVELGVDDKIAKGLAKAAAKLKGFGQQITGIGLKMMAVGGAIAAPLAAAVKSFTGMGDALAKASARTGITVERLAELQYAADQSGASMESLEKGVRKMQQNIADAGRGTQTAVEAFDAIGMSAAALAGLTPDEQFLRIADALQRIQDPGMRAAAAMDIFGRQGAELLPLMQDGRRGIDELMKRARDLGLTMSTQDAKAAEKFGDSLDDVWKIVRFTGNAIGAALVPKLQMVADRLIEIGPRVIAWVKANQALIVTVAKVAAGVIAAGAGLVTFGVAIKGLGVAVGGVGSVISVIGTALGALLSPIGLVSAALVGLGAYFLYATKAGDMALSWLGKKFNVLRDDATKALTGISDALAAGDIALAAQILWTTLEMEFTRGSGSLQGIWTKFTKGLITTFYGGFQGAKAAWEIFTHAIEVAWIETGSFIGKAWDTVCSGLISAFDWVTDQVAKGFLWLQSIFDESFDFDEAAASLDQARNERQQKRDADLQQSLAQREEQRQQSRKQADTEYERKLGEIGQEYNDIIAGADAAAKEGVEGAAERLKELTRQRDELLAKAKHERDRSGDGPGRPKKPELPSEEDFEQIASRGAGVAGTFNGRAAQGIGPGSIMNRVASSSEETAKNTGAIMDHLRGNGGGAFS
jgi:hypothetical protein